MPVDGPRWHSRSSARSGKESPKEVRRMDERLGVVALARKNEFFRQEVITGDHSQLVAMTIPEGGEIGEEVHEENDQILIFVEGEGQAILEGEKSPIDESDLVFVKA